MSDGQKDPQDRLRGLGRLPVSLALQAWSSGWARWGDLGVFWVALWLVPLVTVVPGKYAFHGQLKYQACDKAACYPPRQLPVDFLINVAKGSAARKRNPGQSPHVHR